jgi:hypothetical protein
MLPINRCSPFGTIFWKREGEKGGNEKNKIRNKYRNEEQNKMGEAVSK